ncbi:hypothetical protein [Endozoicomonas lisbonensis]|uniref:Uncharacterized protein n=1 Tax=Endozoicomonas lisbonensis TaxID=3120522 RepID=A0ABV2SEW2_9GAMM
MIFDQNKKVSPDTASYILGHYVLSPWNNSAIHPKTNVSWLSDSSLLGIVEAAVIALVMPVLSDSLLKPPTPDCGDGKLQFRGYGGGYGGEGASQAF